MLTEVRGDGAGSHRPSSVLLEKKDSKQQRETNIDKHRQRQVFIGDEVEISISISEVIIS